jgi:hypothetical protein
MTLNQSDRPRFYEQQYLGSADLDALVDYERIARARHDLGAHSWGIAAGLQLIEKSTKGGVDVYVQPGYAWDGFGRPITVLAPYKVPTEPFKNIPFVAGVDDGNPPGHLVDVWLVFTATPRGGPAFGFEACSVEDQYARIFESFQIAVGDKPTHPDRHAPVTVGVYTVDAEQMPKKLGAATDPPLVDESIGYQTFPDDWDRARWFVPLGSVRWVPAQNAFDTGHFAARVAADTTTSDRKRRYCGVVAETVDAARGFVRVRSRDAAAYAPNVWNTDTEKNLLWVEGSLRVEGDAKLLGGQLLLRDQANGDSGRPLAIRRRETNTMVPAGSDLWAQIGVGETGANRFVVGPITGNTPADFREKLVVKDDGHVGIGVPNPTSAPLVVRAQGGTEDLLAFESPGGALTWKLSTLAGGKAGLNFGEPGGDGRLFLKTGGNVGIGTLDPKHALEIHGDDNSLVVVSDATSGNARNAGLELRTKAADGVQYIDFTKGSTDTANSGTPDFSGRLSFNEANTGAFSLRGGKVGIETTTPTQHLHVNHNSGLRVNHLFMSGGLGGIAEGWSSISYNAHHDDANNTWVFDDTSRRAVTIEMDDAFGFPRFDVWSTTNANKQGWIRRLRIDGESGNIVANSNGGNFAIGQEAAECRLHVAGSTDADAGAISAHIAVIDNKSGGNSSDVLALRIGAFTSAAGNNFITFFAGPNDIGAIEGSGLGISYQTTSADYAEWLARDDGEPAMKPGDVVGVFAGRIRHATNGADHVLVISSAPAIVAGRPEADARDRYEKVAMLGQVPVRVRGPVRAGDLIVPSGDADGTGVAIAPDEASIDDHAMALGVAWQANPGSGVALVRCAIGLPTVHALRSVHRAMKPDARAPRARSKRSRATPDE